MSMLTTAFKLDEIENTRYHPPGRYRGYITGWESGVAGTGTEYIVFSLKANEALSGQDMSGVQMERILDSRRFYLKPGSKVNTQFWDAVRNAMPNFKEHIRATTGKEEVETRDAAELIVGTEVDFDYLPETNKQTGKEYISVQRWKKSA